MLKQAIIYTRFSPRPNAAECDSCEKQYERCQALLDRKEYTNRGRYQDRAVSGGVLNRPGLLAALKGLKPGQVLVVDSSDRLARDMLVNLTIRQQVLDAGATIEYANGSPSEDTPEGKLLTNILAAFSAFERDRIRLRTKQGLDKKRKNGERTTGKVPIGWMLDPNDLKRLVVCKQERNAILRMVRMSMTLNATSTEIANWLNNCCSHCRGKPWSARTIRKLIKRHAFWADPIDGDPSLEPTHP